MENNHLNKWCKEAMFYGNTPRGVKCQICPNECTIKPGNVGDCRNRKNIDGKLYSIAYGNPCTIHIDPIEKKPLYHFYPQSRTFSLATAGCNLACLNCQNWSISQTTPEDTDNYDLMPDKAVETAIKNKCRIIAYTYSEPITFYEYTYDTSVLAHQAGLKNVLVSAGYINEEPLRKLAMHIDAANIDLKSFDSDTYMRLNGGNLKTILNTLLVLKQEGVWIEITNLIVPNWTDDLATIKKMCDWLFENGFEDYPLHFSRFHPTFKLTNLPPTPVHVLDQARVIAKAAGLKHVYVGNVPNHEGENTFCPNCGKTLINRLGFNMLENHISNNTCIFCNEAIAGYW